MFFGRNYGLNDLGATAAQKAAAAAKKAEQQKAAAAKKAAAKAAADAKKKAAADKKAALLQAAREKAAAKLEAKKAATAAKKALAVINRVSNAQAQQMIADGGTWVQRPEGIAASKSDIFVSYKGIIYRANWQAAIPAAQRVAQVKADTAAAVAQGAPPADAAVAALAADAQANPGDPLITNPASVPAMMQASQDVSAGGMLAQQPAASGGGMLAQQAAYGQQMDYSQAQAITEYQPSVTDAAQSELVDEGDYSDQETQEAATAVEAAGSIQVGDEVAEDAPAPAEEAQAEDDGQFVAISPEDEARIYQQAQDEQIAAAHAVQTTSGGGRGGWGGGFFGLGAAEVAKRAGKRAAAKAVAKGATPAQAVAVGRKVARSFFQCVRGYYTPLLRKGVRQVMGK